MKIPDGLTIKVTHNRRDRITRIISYRQGEFKRAYKAVIPVCGHESCKKMKRKDFALAQLYDRCTRGHQKLVDDLVKKLIASYK